MWAYVPLDYIVDAAPCSPRAYTLASRSMSSRTPGAVITEDRAVGRQQGGWGNCTPLSASLTPTCSFLGLHWSPGALWPARVGWRAGKSFCLRLITPFRPAAAEVQPLRGAPGQGRAVTMCSRYLGGQRLERGLHRGVSNQNSHCVLNMSSAGKASWLFRNEVYWP